MSRRQPEGLNLAFLAAPKLVSHHGQRGGHLRAFAGGFGLACVLALILWGML